MAPIRHGSQGPMGTCVTWRKRKEFVKHKKWQKTKQILRGAHENGAMSTNSENVTSEPIPRSVAFLKSGRTMSIALPGSILDNAQSDYLRSYLASQIARSACIYNISEVGINI